MTVALPKNKTFSSAWIFNTNDSENPLHDTTFNENLINAINYFTQKNNLIDKAYFSNVNIPFKTNCLYNQNYLSGIIDNPPVEPLNENFPNTSYNFESIVSNYENIQKAYFSTVQVDSISRLLKLEQLKKMGFYLENPNDIASFIFNNLEIITVLEETELNVSKFFENFKLHLSLYQDIEENYSVLNIIIYSELPLDDLLIKEDILFDNWFVKHYSKFSGKITIRVYPI
jgi:hypothetical protein